MVIKKLTRLPVEFFNNCGHNGYVSHKQYVPAVKIDPVQQSSVVFELKLVDLQKPYVKDWQFSHADFDELVTIIATGDSFGVYEEDQLVGIAIAEEKSWNNTLNLLNILIHKDYHSRGFGTALIIALKSHALERKFRLIELEVQNTNFPAISFYRKQGFHFTGLNLALYDQVKTEIAIFMSCSLEV